MFIRNQKTNGKKPPPSVGNEFRRHARVSRTIYITAAGVGRTRAGGKRSTVGKIVGTIGENVRRRRIVGPENRRRSGSNIAILIGARKRCGTT